MKIRTGALIILLPLAIIDAIIPVPIVGLILLYVILVKPMWFWKFVGELYGRG